MAPFLPPDNLLSGLKERIESITVQGERLYVGTAIGSLYIYTFDDDSQHVTLVETKKALSRRAIEQLAFIKDVNSLALLSDSMVTLYPLPGLTPPTPLAKTKGAFSFALRTTVEHLDAEGQNSKDTSQTHSMPTVITRLAVGCRRKMVVYSWHDGEPQAIQEATLPHSPRAMSFLDGETICFGYSPTEYALFSFKTLLTTELITPLISAASSTSISSVSGAFSGLSGYMTLGLGAKAKPCVLGIADGEALVAKDNNGFFINAEGKLNRTAHIDWPAPPDETAFVKPYIFSILPPGTVPTSQVDSSSIGTISFIPSAVVEVRSSISLNIAQTLPFPFPPTSANTPPSALNHSIRVLTSPSAKSPLFLVTTPTDRPAATAEGSTIWQIRMKPWGEQLDELVAAGLYADALALLETVDAAMLPDKGRRRRLVRSLNAVHQFRSAQFDDAINTFIDLDINPAKVVALFPENIAGRLSVPQDEWISLFGGPSRPPEPISASQDESHKEADQDTTPGPAEHPPTSSPKGSIRGAVKTGLESLVASPSIKDDETSSVLSGKRKERRKDDFHLSVETLLRYLSDRRPKIAGALEALGITSAQSHQMPFLSAASRDDLFSLPSSPLTVLTPEELVRFAQIVDTALFKSYLLVRPGLLAPLCRVGNWCEVSEVEEVLLTREKYSELIYLYNGKKMHGKALDLLQKLSEKETDMQDKLTPSINYLQRLGPEHLEQIFQSSLWVFQQDPNIAFEIFTSEEVELPRQPVADYLEKIDPSICARYVEFLIEERGEQSAEFHDRLAELYLHMTVNAKKRSNQEVKKSAYAKLLQFIDTTEHYHVDRLFGLLPSEDLFEAKAILLGRLGRHDSALEIYVYRLQDFLKAEEYCKRVYQPSGLASGVYLTLLRIYLRPTSASPSSASLLAPALELISRHSAQLDALTTLDLLPPLVSAQDIQAFLLAALRAPHLDTRVIREVGKAREEQVTRRLMQLQTRRVKVTDSRICPQCHKRLGHSVIAVHSPRGEVTHYQCREAFSRKLKEMKM